MATKLLRLVADKKKREAMQGGLYDVVPILFDLHVQCIIDIRTSFLTQMY